MEKFWMVFWTILGFPFVLCFAIWSWITKDRKWCKSQGIGFKRIWNCEWGLYSGILEEWYEARKKKEY